MKEKDVIKYCGFCKREIEEGTGFWLHPNRLGIKYVHQICYYDQYNLGRSILSRFKI